MHHLGVLAFYTCSPIPPSTGGVNRISHVHIITFTACHALRLRGSHPYHAHCRYEGCCLLRIRGESAKGTSPSAALRTQREPLSSLGSHHPTIGLTPSFQCGNMPGCILAISPSLCSARLLWCLSFLYFLIAHKQSLRLICFSVGYMADL